LKIRAGSVGIGGAQTGIYPMDSPGGWQLLGMTPVQTYNPKRDMPILFEAGNFIRFVPISEEEYADIEGFVSAGTYEYVTRKKEV
jgi:allophanate hydrolase subunit 1